MSYQSDYMQDYFRSEPEPEAPEVKLYQCTECGGVSDHVIEVIDPAEESTYFHPYHMPEGLIMQRMWVNDWYRKYAGGITEQQIYNLIIVERRPAR
jgi:hypothetical protein